MLGRVGEDDFGRQMIASLVSVGCGVEGVRALAGLSGVALNLIAESGQNSIMVVPGANGRFAPEDVAADTALLRGARFALLQLKCRCPRRWPAPRWRVRPASR